MLSLDHGGWFLGSTRCYGCAGWMDTGVCACACVETKRDWQSLFVLVLWAEMCSIHGDNVLITLAILSLSQHYGYI